jgi:hypothetical protein
MSKPLPQKLEDDLGNVKRFKASTPKRDENMPNGSRPFPRRRSMPPSNNLQKVFDDQVERSMYDEIFGHMLPQQRASQQTKFAAGSAVDALRQATTSEDASSDFTTNLLSRLRLVEKEAKENREKLAAEVFKNGKLTEEVARLRRSSEEPNYALNQLRVAKRENEDLKQQLQDMEEFLADYGLVWVGKQGQRNSQGQIADENDSGEEASVSEGGHLAPFSAFAKAVQELNAVIYSEPTQVVIEQEAKKGRLVQAAERVERIKLAYYKNGVMIKNGPFRRSDSDSYRTFVSDILDGYFPSEFRDMYPDGVIFDLVDKHNDTYYDHIHSNSSSSSEPATSAQQFLNRLPKTVVQNGNIVNVRDEIADRLQGNASKPSDAAEDRSRSSFTSSILAAATSSANNGAVTNKNGMIIMQTFAVRTGILDSNGEVSSHSASNSSDVKDIVRVNVRWTDDKKSVLQAAMFAYDTILHLRQELALHFGVAVDEEMAARVLELRTAYPAKVLNDDVTLREAGLVPNGTVHARRLQSKSDGIAASSESSSYRLRK